MYFIQNRYSREYLKSFDFLGIPEYTDKKHRKIFTSLSGIKKWVDHQAMISNYNPLAVKEIRHILLQCDAVYYDTKAFHNKIASLDLSAYYNARLQYYYLRKAHGNTHIAISLSILYDYSRNKITPYNHLVSLKKNLSFNAVKETIKNIKQAKIKIKVNGHCFLIESKDIILCKLILSDVIEDIISLDDERALFKEYAKK